MNHSYLILSSLPTLTDSEEIFIAFVIFCLSIFLFIFWQIFVELKITDSEKLQTLQSLDYFEATYSEKAPLSFRFEISEITRAKTNLWQKLVTRKNKLTLISGSRSLDR